MKLRTVARISMICVVMIATFGFLYFVTKQVIFCFIALGVCIASAILLTIFNRCPYCGRFLRGWRYCPHCGSKLEWK